MVGVITAYVRGHKEIFVLFYASQYESKRQRPGQACEGKAEEVQTGGDQATDRAPEESQGEALEKRSVRSKFVLARLKTPFFKSRGICGQRRSRTRL
jgi:hypothetical protein